MIDFSDIQAAQRRIRGFIYQTPLEELRFWPREKNSRREVLVENQAAQTLEAQPEQQRDKIDQRDQVSTDQRDQVNTDQRDQVSTDQRDQVSTYRRDQVSTDQNNCNMTDTKDSSHFREGTFPGNYYLKLESQQKTRSFKVRGAFSKLTSLSEREKRTGVLAVSSGNHGAAVSYAASLLEIPAIVVVPEPTPQSKIKLIRHYGAEVRVTGKDYNEAHRRAHQLLEEEGLIFVDPCSDPEVIAGQGTIGLEIMDQNPGIQTILVPVGGGGLITGVSLAAKNVRPDVKVIGFQTEACPAMVRALAEDKFYEEFPIEDSICDALLGGVGRIPFEMAPDWLDEVLPVSEENIKKALLHLITEEKVMAEPSAVLGLAGLLEYPGLLTGTCQSDLKQEETDREQVENDREQVETDHPESIQPGSNQPEADKPIKMGETAIVISGGNIDGSLLRKLFLEEEIN